MGRTLSEMMKALPKKRRARIEARFRELKDEVEVLQQSGKPRAVRSSPAGRARKRVARRA